LKTDPLETKNIIEDKQFRKVKKELKEKLIDAKVDAM
jgi:hypothetical protein